MNGFIIQVIINYFAKIFKRYYKNMLIQKINKILKLIYKSYQIIIKIVTIYIMKH